MCGRQKENKGKKQRHLTTAVGDVAFVRRYWKCVCGSGGSYAVDAVLGVEGERSTKTVQKHLCRLSADTAFASASEHMHEMLGVKLCPETVRRVVERHGKKMARFQEEDTASEQAFREAPGEVEFTIDAGKANTREEGWKDLKIGVIAKRESGKPTKLDDYKKQHLPAATMVLAFAMIAPSKEFRQGWRERFKRLGVTSMASIHVLADGANWIWKAVGRVLTGCVQTLDFYHACQHLNKCAERIHGERIHGERIQGERVSKTCATSIAYRRGRSLLLSQGWGGVCQWVAELLAATDSTDVADEKRRRKATDRMIGYFSKHLSRLNYAERLGAGRAIGSGQVEGQAKTLGLRLKLRGARWNKKNVRPMASLVCVRHSSQWAAYWQMAA